MHKLFAKVRRNQKGFTLIEMLVVVAIIGLLAAFAVPRLFEAINSAKSSRGTADLDTIAGALERYYIANNEYPHANLTTALVPQYLKRDTTLLNGFDRGYIYGTNANGSGYVLIDVAQVGDGTIVTVTCGAATHDFTVTKTGVVAHYNLTGDPSTCAVTSPTPSATNNIKWLNN